MRTLASDGTFMNVRNILSLTTGVVCARVKEPSKVVLQQGENVALRRSQGTPKRKAGPGSDRLHKSSISIAQGLADEHRLLWCETSAC